MWAFTTHETLYFQQVNVFHTFLKLEDIVVGCSALNNNHVSNPGHTGLDQYANSPITTIKIITPMEIKTSCHHVYFMYSLFTFSSSSLFTSFFSLPRLPDSHFTFTNEATHWLFWARKHLYLSSAFQALERLL
jgi:hypothetical protein